MTQAGSVLLLTRPEPQSRSFLSDLEERLGYRPTCLVSPIMRIAPLGNDVDLNAYRTLILTSGNAVGAVGTELSGRSVVTVGERTAASARSLGANATCLGANVDDLIARIEEVDAPALHIRGRHSRGDLAKRASDLGVLVDDVVVYEQLEVLLSDEAQALLREGRAVLPLFSPRSAQLVAAYECHVSTRVIAMSKAVADAWNEQAKTDKETTIAAKPERSAMIDLVAESF